MLLHNIHLIIHWLPILREILISAKTFEKRRLTHIECEHIFEISVSYKVFRKMNFQFNISSLISLRYATAA